MTAEQILRKKPFVIPVPKEVIATTPQNVTGAPAIITMPADVALYETRSQADFIREFNPSSHAINSIKYYPNSLFVNKTSGSYQAKVRSRVAIGFQSRILEKRADALLGNNVGMRLIAGATNPKMLDELAFIREGWEDKDMEVAIHDAIRDDYKVGDVAVYVFMSDKKVHYRIFSYNLGDVLYPHYDTLTGELALLGRLYTQTDWDGKTGRFLDVIDKTHFVTYRQKADASGWEMEDAPVAHGFSEIPVAYHRSDSGPVWSFSQSLIDSYEVGISQFCENNAAYALRILYTLGADMEVMANTDGTPNRIDSSDANAKVGFLEPAQGADGSFAKQLEILEKNIMRGSFAVETPEIKSGSDLSSRTVKMLFADSYLKAMSDSMEYQAFINRILTLFKHGYYTEQGKAAEANNLKVKAYLEPFIFMSENDVISSIQMLVASGCMSKKTATELAYNIGYSSPDEINRITQEAHDELVGQQQASGLDKQTHNPVNDFRAAQANA